MTCYTVFQECQSGNSNNDPYNLRGIISTDQNGCYGFESIFPGYYAGRPRHFHYKITSPSGLELITQCYFEVDPLIDGDWEENHPGLVIPLEETENGLVGVFDIVMNEEASIVSIDNKPFTLPKRFSLNTLYPNPFNNSIIGLPLKYDNDIFYIYGDFCSLECGARYAYEYFPDKFRDIYSLINLVIC